MKHKIFCSFVATVFTISNTLADILPGEPEKYVNSISGNSVRMDSLFIVKDDKFDVPTPPPIWSTINFTYLVKDYVSFELNDDLHWKRSESFTCTLDLKITRWDANGDSIIEYPQLVINYDTAFASHYKNKATYLFYNAHKFKVEIVLVDLSDSANANLFKLSGCIEIERNYEFHCSAPDPVTHTYISANDQLRVNWTPVAGATDYDFEWTVYSDSSYEVKNITSYTDYDSLFQYNASRINTTGDSALLSLVYPEGCIFYRVRAVRQLSDGQRELGTWTNDTSYKYFIPWHEDSLNWQSTITFAEEGKRKQLVNYYDGSLRKRQSITKINTDNEVVVGETIYDYQGRLAVNAMPVPSNESKLQFFNKFNLFASNVPYSRLHFDTGGCGFVPYPMDSISGAAKYYSENNPLQSAFNQFIPASDGYPFSLTEYTQDNTGRISRQGGVGTDLKLGSDHETKYYYGKPAPVELDRLFGNDVGFASHYTKEMVMDANGQISVSYKDAHGRVIATALAGEKPDSLDALLNFPTADSVLTINLIETQTSDPPSISSSYSFLAPKQATYVFIYNLFPESVGIYNCEDTAEIICYDCLYDITITISDNCGNAFNTAYPGQPYDTTYRNYSPSMFDTACTGYPSAVIDTFALVLPIGSYTVSKTATISPDAIDFYWQIFLEENTCLNVNSFIDSAIAQIDFTGCFMDCDACTTSLGTQSNFLDNYIQNLVDQGITPNAEDTTDANELFETIAANCEELCNGKGYCDNYLEILKNDVSPGGQYGGYAVDTTDGHYYFPDNTSMYFDLLGSGSAPYMDPVLDYLDESGNPDSVENSLGNWVSPNNLNPAEFVQNWQDSWADALVVQHPEYCYYIFCDSNSASHGYDLSMLQIQTYAGADTLGFFDPIGIDTSYADSLDPFFDVSGYGFSFLSELTDTMNVFYIMVDSATSCFDTLSIWQIAAITALKQDTSFHFTCGFRVDPDTMCEGDQNMMWRVFRALYQVFKQKYFAIAEQDFASGNGCCNKCIGSDIFQYQQLGHEHPAPAGCNSASTGTCGNSKYFTKHPRFVSYPPDYFINSFGNSSSAYQYLDTNLTQHCESMCASYAVTWWSKLSGCAMSSADSTAMIDSLIAVCIYGCDLQHPWGSSTSPPGAPCTSGYCTFEDIIEHFRDINNCDTTVMSYLLIDFPPPYDQPANVGMGEVYDTIPPCVCDNLELLWEHYSSSYPDSTVTDFSEYLNHYFESELTPVEIDMLLSFCDSANTCNHLAQPIVLPEVLSCETCIPCDTLEWHFNHFVQLYPNALGSINYPELLTTYYNQALSFSLTFSDYLGFMNKCHIEPPFEITCDTIVPLWNYYSANDSINDYYPFVLWLNLHFDVLNTLNYYNSNLNCENVNYSSGHQLNCNLLQEAYIHYIKHTDVYSDPNFYDSLVTFFCNNYWSSVGSCIASIKTSLEGSCGIVETETTPDCQDLTPYIAQFLADTAGHPPIIHFVDSLVSWLYHLHFPLAVSFSLCSYMDTIPDCDSLEAVVDSFLTINIPVPIDLFLNDYFGYNYPFESYQMWLNHCGITLPLELCDRPLCETVHIEELNDCIEQLLETAIANAQHNYELYADSIKGSFLTTYFESCMNPYEVFNATSKLMEYQYTLYYYDQGDNLVRTIPPSGVKILSSAQVVDVQDYRDTQTGSPVYNAHELATTYYYNSLNKVTMQNGPDDSTKWFWYDLVGRLVASQNFKQKAEGNNKIYSYTMYDDLGRIIEVGKIKQDTTMSNAISRNPSDLAAWYNTTRRYEITNTYYDIPQFTFSGFSQENLRGRVTSVTYEDQFDNDSSTYNSASHYTYDIAGNIKSLLQENTALASIGRQFKRINYEYDLISGKVNSVFYQPDSVDKFIHKYEYDGDNRITDVLTSTNTVTWDHDAFYQYYKHGPLARTILGERQVQGLDYAYSLQGWIKGVNSSQVSDSIDMGMDSKTGTQNEWIGRDAYGYTLGYFWKDYRPIGGNEFEASYAGSGLQSKSPSLYNGNIRYSMVSLPQLTCAPNIAYGYTYDQLNRITGMWPFNNFDTANFKWNALDTTWGKNNYREQITYDPNGNILTYMRRGTECDTAAMDGLTYRYYSGTNKLHWVDDRIAPGNYSTDIDDQATGNYKYDKNGNLIYDFQEKDSIWWNNYGKIDSLRSYGTDSMALKFRYDPQGNRIEKKQYTLKTDTVVTSTYYVRDAQGNIMATYEWKDSDTLKVKEFDIYGSSRLGVWNADTILYTADSGTFVYNDTIFFTFDGRKQYELINHLGNVLTTISDKHIPLDTNSNDTVDYYIAEVLSQQDYYPFGMLMPERSYNAGNYRFGFNGHEKDDEIKGFGNSLDFGDRMYDPRVGRWLSIDRRFKDYVPFSPYNFALNNPTNLIDIDGNIVVDANGHPVTVSITQAKNGTVSATYEFAKGTSQAIIDNFNANAARVINTLIQTTTGREQVQKVIDSQDKIHTYVVSSDIGKPVYAEGGIELGGTRGALQPVIDAEGNPTSQTEQIIKVSIYESSIDQVVKNTKNPELIQDPNSRGNEFESNKLTPEQRIAAVAAHEYEHATNPIDSKLVKENKELKRTDPQHKVAYDKGRKVAKEFGDINKNK